MQRRADSNTQSGTVSIALLRVCGAAALWVALCLGTARGGPRVGLHQIARAEPPRGLATQLLYRAPAGCPPQAELERRLRARLHGVTLDTAAGNTTLEVRIEQRGRVRGSIVLSSAERVLGQRDIEANQCGEAVDALAFIAALLLEEGARAITPAGSDSSTDTTPTNLTVPAPQAPAPSASTASSASATPVMPATPATSATSATPATPAAPARPRDEARAESPPVVATVVPVPQPPRMRHSRTARASLFGGLSLVSGVAPSARPGLSAGAGLALLQGSRAALSLSLGMRASLPQEVRSSDGAGRFAWWSSVGLLCADLHAQSAVRISLCATAELGRIIAQGRQTNAPVTQRARWLALGPTARLAWPLVGPLWLEPALGVLLPTTRDRFVVGASQLHAVPRLTFRAELALAVRLP